MILPGWDQTVLTGGPATEKEKSNIRKWILCDTWSTTCVSYGELWFVQQSIPRNSGTQQKKLHMRCGLLDDDYN